MATRVKLSVQDRLRDMADRLDGKIDGLRADRDTHTPKKALQAKSARVQADHLERVQTAMRLVADRIDAGTLPKCLEGVKTKAAFEKMLSTRLDTSGGYYSLVDTGEYHDKTEAALAVQQMVDGTTPARDPVQDKIKSEIEELRFLDIGGFYPTPDPIVDLLIESAGISAGQDVLEPSAGIGSIADKMREIGANVSVCEINYRLASILGLKGYRPPAPMGSEMTSCDCLDLVTGQYDRVVMNPPFEKGADIKHITHCFGLLRPGGILVSVLSSGYSFRNERKYVEFREFLDANEAEEIYLCDHDFTGRDSFRRTGVNFKALRIVKPH